MKSPPRILAFLVVSLPLIVAAQSLAPAQLLAAAEGDLAPAGPGFAPGPPPPVEKQATAWLTNPDWRMWIDDYGYSDYIESYRPAFRVAYPWNWQWSSDLWLSGDWAAAVYYDQIPTLPITQGPNTGQPETMWLEPNFMMPNWISNSNFWVVNPVTSWNRGELPPPYLDTATSTISNGQLMIQIYSALEDSSMAMGRCSNWPWAWTDYVMADRYVLSQQYTITNISGQTLTNLELAQFLHGHPGEHNENAIMGDWEVYDPFRKTVTDVHKRFQYDLTQWGSQYVWTWPWVSPWWGNTAIHFISFSSDVAPSTLRSPSPWGLGDYMGHVAGKPPRPGVHWDVEEHNLNPLGPPCYLYPPSYPTFGQQVAGAENWYLDSTFLPGEQVTHEVMLGLAIRAHHGWHWAPSWWYWHGYPWPTPIPRRGWGPPHPLGWPSYYYVISWPYWWNCYSFPPGFGPAYFGLSWPVTHGAMNVVSVTGRSAVDPMSPPQDFLPDPAVTAELEANWPWPGHEWRGFTLPSCALTDSTFQVEVVVEGVFEGDTSFFVHTMIGDAEFGWSPDHYDSTLVEIQNPSDVPSELVGEALTLSPSHPNPFNALTKFDFTLPTDSPVKIEIYDLAGRLITTLLERPMPAGRQEATWSGRDDRGGEVGSGVYMVRLTACGQTLSRAVTIIK